MTKATKNTVKLTADEKRALGAIIATCDNLDGDLFTRPADAVLAIIDTLGCSGQAAGGYITSLGNKGILDTEEDGYGLGFWVNADTVDEEEWREVEDGWLYMECKDSISIPGPGDFIEWNDTEIPVRGGAWADEMNAHLYTVIDTISFWGRWPFLVCRDNAEGTVFALKGTLADDAATDISHHEEAAETGEAGEIIAEQPAANAAEEQLGKAMRYKAERVEVECESVLMELRSLQADIAERIERIEALMDGGEQRDLDSVGRVQYEVKWAEVAIKQAHKSVNEIHADMRGTVEAWGVLKAVAERIER